MAAIAQPDQFQILSRRIGYSVGLEKLVERVKKLVALYEQNRSVSATAFRDLVEREFGRRNAVDHFANFYGTLNLIRVTGRDSDDRIAGRLEGGKKVQIPKTLEPLYQLDSLSILRRLFKSDESKYHAAMQVVLTQSLIEADGDVFLNALASDFEEGQLKSRLEAMVQTKLEKLRGVIRTQSLRERLHRIIAIKNESSPGLKARREAKSNDRFARRTEPLDSFRRTEPLEGTRNDSIDIPPDYLSKVSQSRKGWSEDLGLYHADSKTERGGRLLRSLMNCIFWTDSEPPAVLFWGYTSELAKLRVTPSEIGAPDIESWDLLSSIAESFQHNRQLAAAQGPDELIELLKSMFALYKEGSSKGLIRNSLPLYVAEPVLAGWCVAESRELPALNSILEDEYKKEVRAVQKMIIKGTAGALFFMR